MEGRGFIIGGILITKNKQAKNNVNNKINVEILITFFITFLFKDIIYFRINKSNNKNKHQKSNTGN